MKHPFALGLTTLALMNGASAGETPNPQQLEDVVVTAARVPQSVHELLADVSVISGEEIRRAGQSTLVEVLQAQPGVEVASSGGYGAVSSVYLRGANAGQTLVLVDGMRLGSATTGMTALENIPLSQIERIEILRGPASSLYGSDAIGGVIQIFTRGGSGAPRANLSLGADSFNTQIVSAGFGGEAGNTRFNVQAGYANSVGFSAYSDGNPLYFDQNRDKDAYRNRSLSARLAQTLSPGQEIGINAFASSGRSHFDGYVTTTDFYQDQTLAAFDVYSRNRISDVWQSLVRVGLGEDHANVYGFSPQADVFDTNQNQLLWQNDIAIGPGSALLGVERLVQKVGGSVDYSVSERTIQSVFAGYQARLAQHSFQLNLRNDDNSQFGSQNTGYLGYDYRLTPAWRIGASAGSAFKAPTFNDLYYPGAGNPNLLPEEARNLEAALRYDQGAQHFSLVVFDNRVSNLIAWAPVAPGSYIWAPANVDEASLRGATFAWSGQVESYRLEANLTLQNPEDANTGMQLVNRAREHGALRAGGTLAGWNINGELIFSGKRYGDPANTQVMGGYGVVNLAARYPLEQGWSLLARANNLFDKQYEQVQGYNTPGANLFVGIQYSPKQ